MSTIKLKNILNQILVENTEEKEYIVTYYIAKGDDDLDYDEKVKATSEKEAIAKVKKDAPRLARAFSAELVKSKSSLKEGGNLGHNEISSISQEGPYWIVTYRGSEGTTEKSFPSEEEARKFQDGLDENYFSNYGEDELTAEEEETDADVTYNRGANHFINGAVEKAEQFRQQAIEQGKLTNQDEEEFPNYESLFGGEVEDTAEYDEYYEGLQENEEENSSNEFGTLVSSFAKYLNDISRDEMFDDSGNYNSTLKNYHDTFKQYAENGTEEEQLKANFLLGFI